MTENNPNELFDLAVKAALADFPNNEIDAFIYARSGIEKETGNVSSFVVHGGLNANMANCFLSFMLSDENAKNSVFNAVLTYFEAHKGELPKFKQFLGAIDGTGKIISLDNAGSH